MIAEFVSTACAGIFAGAAIYISLVQQPAAAELGTATALRFFRPMYARAAPMQASLALVGSTAALWAWWRGSGSLWLAGALLLLFVIPFTLIVVMPTNNRLMDPTLDPSSHEADDLQARWSRLHAIRSLVSLSAFLFLLGALVGS